MRRGLALGLCALLAACAGAPKKAPPPAAATVVAPPAAPPAPPASPYPPAQEDPSKRGDYVAGGLYAPHVKDSAPDELPDVDRIPEPEVREEPRSRYGNRSYSVLGKCYEVLERADGYVEQGLASYYGRKFHGRRTSSLEVYDMYAFTAAHKTLPLPSYVRVTNLDNGKSVVVRVNDRGPFHPDRIIDLSYAAAVKLDLHHRGVGRVEVRALTPGERAADTAVAAAGNASTAAPAHPAATSPAPQAHAAPAPVPGASAAAPSTGAGVILQLASFTARANAERALAMLQLAGIADARLHEAQAGGQPVWRLRVGPVDPALIAELSRKVAGLGLGPPNPVRD
ncbi:septal ring lytic transglycosylase RlpA family protein [Vulcaniibacterium gelatinicum]|uniref:septal ring lytic transglycosylase RlpA family protein n=1 Tax=Vulcaniibacterium gelatinicum TaxID=2598725 RepID=UPI0011CBA5F5|nr:septal ring lytic transglycosylase RlpA family protein [Vulcaniibacterium gelatinicum]